MTAVAQAHTYKACLRFSCHHNVCGYGTDNLGVLLLNLGTSLLYLSMLLPCSVSTAVFGYDTAVFVYVTAVFGYGTAESIILQEVYMCTIQYLTNVPSHEVDTAYLPL